MAGGDELVRVARNKKKKKKKKKKKNATLKFLPQNIMPGRYYLFMHLENKINTRLHFFQKRNFCRKKKLLRNGLNRAYCRVSARLKCQF